MGNVFVSVGVSLDGFMAGNNRGPANPLGDRGATIHQWIYRQRSFRRQLGLASDGETGPDDDLLAATFARIGANIMGKRMFEEGERAWPADAPFHTPVFVLTQERRASWERPGGTVFHFVQDDVRSVLARAREVAGDKDVRISGGANVIRQYLAAGLVDELHVAIAPVLFGSGLRAFDGIERRLEIADVLASPSVTHVRYRVTG